MWLTVGRWLAQMLMPSTMICFPNHHYFGCQCCCCCCVYVRIRSGPCHPSLGTSNNKPANHHPVYKTAELTWKSDGMHDYSLSASSEILHTQLHRTQNNVPIVLLDPVVSCPDLIPTT